MREFSRPLVQCQNSQAKIYWGHARPLKGRDSSRNRYCTAMVTVLEVTPPILRTTGTALPGEASAGTRAFT